MLSVEAVEEDAFYAAGMSMTSKRGNRPLKGQSRKTGIPPRRPDGAMDAKHNRELNRQARKMLGRHYRAKYRVR